MIITVPDWLVITVLITTAVGVIFNAGLNIYIVYLRRKQAKEINRIKKSLEALNGK